MNSLVLVFHFILCVFIIIAVLLQSGKGASIGTTFGGGSSQTVFGARGAATFLSKLTTVAAILFLITSLYLAKSSKQESVINKVSPPKPTSPVSDTLPAETQNETQNGETRPGKTPETKPK